MGKRLTPAAQPRIRRSGRSFYKYSTLTIAEKLLGMCLVRSRGRKRWVGRVVETEAYIGESDPACHAFRGLTPRTKVMYGPPGHAYVYFTYGMHFMLNVVTEDPGFPAAVLIRALEPVHGFNLTSDPRPASGPAKLCRAMRIDRSLNGVSLQGEKLWIGSHTGASRNFEVRWSPRIGISTGQDRIWRAYIFGNSYVSRKSNPSDAVCPSGL